MDARYRIRCNGEEIGASELEERDSGMGIATGVFVPSPAYERVRATFRIFSEAMRETGPADQEMIDRYYRERDKLGLTVVRPDGTLLRTSVVHISDFSEGPNDDSYEVEVHIDDPAFFEVAARRHRR